MNRSENERPRGEDATPQFGKEEVEFMSTSTKTDTTGFARFGGVFPAITTPMTEGGDAVDTDAIQPLCDFLIEKGVHGLFALGSTGEGVLLSLAERRSVAERVIDAARGRVPVIVNVGALTTRDAVALTGHAAEAGADAVALVSPFYYKLTDDQQVAHYAAVLQAAGELPVFLYNIPQATGNTITLDILRRLTQQAPNLAGLKDSSGSVPALQELLFNAPEHLRVFVGEDLVDLVGLLLGAHGIVSSISGVFPEPYVALYEAVQAGDLSRAKEAQKVINELIKCLTVGPHVAMCKAALALRGVPVGPTRAPIQWTPDAHREVLQKALGIVAK